MREVVQRAAARLGALASWAPEPLAAIADLDGRPLFVSDPRRTASLAATGAHAVQFFADGFAPGDAAVSNDPFIGAWHVTDFTVLRRANRGIALTRMTLPDIGGFEFGGLAPQSFDTWGEGARFPMLRIAVQGALRREGLQLVSLNSRTPALIAQGLAAMSVVASELCDAIDAAPALGDALLGSAAGAATSALERLRPGSYRVRTPVDSPLLVDPPTVDVELTIAADGHRISFAGSDPQLEAPLNSPPGLTLDRCLGVLADAVDGFPLQPGALVGLEIDTGAGTVAGAQAPAITGLAPYYTSRAISRALTTALSDAGAGGVTDPDTWWQSHGRVALEARVDVSVMRLRHDRVAALRSLEARARGHDDRPGGHR